jgi:hypothetical protein
MGVAPLTTMTLQMTDLDDQDDIPMLNHIIWYLAEDYVACEYSRPDQSISIDVRVLIKGQDYTLGLELSAPSEDVLTDEPALTLE